MTVLLKPKEVAERLRINVSTVYQLAKVGKIGSYRIGGAVRISEEQLEEYLQGRIMPPLERPPRKPWTRRS